MYFLLMKKRTKPPKRSEEREEFRNALFCLLLLTFIHNIRCWEKESANDYEWESKGNTVKIIRCFHEGVVLWQYIVRCRCITYYFLYVCDRLMSPLLFFVESIYSSTKNKTSYDIFYFLLFLQLDANLNNFFFI